MCVAVGCTSDI